MRGTVGREMVVVEVVVMVVVVVGGPTSTIFSSPPDYCLHRGPVVVVAVLKCAFLSSPLESLLHHTAFTPSPWT